jgi:hypothetical protein
VNTFRVALIALACTGIVGCARDKSLPSPALTPIDDLPPGQYYDQALPAPHDVHRRPYTTLVPVPDSDLEPVPSARP